MKSVDTMSQRSRISELSAIIHTNTSKIDEYLSANGLPPLSFDAHGPSKLPDPIAPLQVTILEATDELNALVQGPVPFIINLTVSNVLKSLLNPLPARPCRTESKQLTNWTPTAQLSHQPTCNLPFQNCGQHPHRQRSHLCANSGAVQPG